MAEQHPPVSDHQTPMSDHQTPSRRSLLRSAAVAGAALPLVAACSSLKQQADPPAQANPPTGRTHGTNGQTVGKGANAGGTGGGSKEIVATGQVPKGGGVILATDGVVVTQPAAGQFRGFSSTCTHMGCTLNNVSDGTINCICHGSRFSIVDGHVVQGPATTPLPKVAISVSGKAISLG